MEKKHAKLLVEEWVEKKLDEDLGSLAATAAVVAAPFVAHGLSKLSGMHGEYADRRWDTGHAGPISRSDREFAKNYPTGYDLGDHIKHMIFGKSGNDKEGEVYNARQRHDYEVHKGNPKAIELNGGYDPLAGVRNGIPVNPDKAHELDYVKAVIQHAHDTNNMSAEPADDEEDFRDNYNLGHAAAEHLARENVIPRFGDGRGDGHYLDKVILRNDGLHAVYRQNSMRGLAFTKKIDY